MFASTSSAAAYGYDPYGVPLQATVPTTDFVYAGMFFNADSGLYLTKYRGYDPIAGRWLSRDLIGELGDVVGNLYTYVSGNPPNATDISGLWSSTIPQLQSLCPYNDSGDLAPAAGDDDDDVVKQYKKHFGKAPPGADDSKPAIHQLTPPPPIGFGGGGGTKGPPKSPKNFVPPTNPPQLPPATLPEGHSVRVMPPTADYPNGYWVQTNPYGQPVNPATGKPPSNVTRPESRSQTHVPLPPP